MPVQNSEVADVFNEVADLLEIEGENQFRVRAYREAARTVGGHSRSVAEMVEQDEDLTELPGIGKDLADKIREIVENGKLSQAEELEKRTEPGLRELLGLPSLGRERVRELHERLGVRNLQELEEAARDGKISDLPGFGKKTEQNILEAIERLPERHRYVLVRRYALDDGESATLAELREELKVSRERVRQLQREAEQMLKVGRARGDL